MTAMGRDREIMSGFGEVRLPLLKELPLIKELSLKLALRGDFYEDADNSINPQYGLVWRPAKNWLVRAAYGTSFRPPSLLELFPQTTEFQLPIVDSRRGGSMSFVNVASGGNPRLENISAHSFTGGVEYRPNQHLGLRWRAHYWRIVLDNRIVTPRSSDVGKIEEIFPDRVRRYAPTAADDIAGWPGALQSVDLSLLNYGRLETSGIDLDLSYGLGWESGQLQAALTATWMNDYSSEDLSPLESLDRIGIANLQGTIPDWRLVGSLTWKGKSWGTSATAKYTPRYRDADLTGPLDRHLPSRTLIDMQAWWLPKQLFEPDFFKDVKLIAGAVNVLDEDVDFANVGVMLGFDISQADLTQRFVYLRVTKGF